MQWANKEHVCNFHVISRSKGTTHAADLPVTLLFRNDCTEGAFAEV